MLKNRKLRERSAQEIVAEGREALGAIPGQKVRAQRHVRASR